MSSEGSLTALNRTQEFSQDPGPCAVTLSGVARTDDSVRTYRRPCEMTRRFATSDHISRAGS